MNTGITYGEQNTTQPTALNTCTLTKDEQVKVELPSIPTKTQQQTQHAAQLKIIMHIFLVDLKRDRQDNCDLLLSHIIIKSL